MIKVLELFAGIGACSKALTNLGIEHEIVDAVEIDKYAVKSFNAIHGTNFEPQDITKWDKDIECDLIMHGSPCQDFSVAGKQAGGDKNSGTRSSLMYETLRIVAKLKPKYVIWENVKNLLSKKHRHNFDAYIVAMSELGYESKYQVLNAKDFGIPQNRERVFTVSYRLDGSADEYDSFVQDFQFPEPKELTIRLKDILEESVDESFYLSEEQTSRLRQSTFNQQKSRENNLDSVTPTLCARDYKDPQCVRVGGLYDKEGRRHQAGSVYDPEGVAATLSTMQGGNQEPIIVASRGRGDPPVQTLEPNQTGTTNTITSVAKDNYLAEPCDGVEIVEDFYKNRPARHYDKASPTIRADRQGLKVAIRTANQKGYDLAENGDGIDLSYPQSQTRRGRVGHGVSKTLMGMDSMGTLDNYRIRKLTPKECWRLMGFSDEDFEKAKNAGVSNSQLYKQAGNSIVVNVLMGILCNLLEKS